MTGSLVFYRKDGLRWPNGEIECTYTRSWKLNSMGVAKISIPINEPKLTAGVVAYGGFVVIEDDRAGTWAGMVWPPYTETDDGVEITAYTMEKALAQRRVTPQKITGSAGTIFATLIDIANVTDDTRIAKGSIDLSGLSWTEEFKNEKVFDVIVRLASNSGQYWAIDPAFNSDGRLFFSASWATVRGKDYNVRLEEGMHFVRPRGQALTEDGDIANDIIVYGNSSTGATLTARQIDAGSQALYGLRQDSIGIDADNTTTLNAAANVLIRQRAFPQRDHRLFLADVPITADARAFDFAHEGDSFIMYRPGHGYNASGTHGGYEARVRVLAREYNATDGRMALTVREVAQ